jgi:Alginate lyase
VKKNILSYLAVLSIIFISEASNSKSFDEVIKLYDFSTGGICKLTEQSGGDPVILKEIFPNVITKTPGRNSGAAQLFEPIRKIAEPLSLLGSQCLSVSQSKINIISGAQTPVKSCRAFEKWVDMLYTQDALYFDRVKHKMMPASFVTGSLSGNLTIRPIAMYTDLLRDRGYITLQDDRAFDAWLKRRSAEYENIPEKPTSAAAQNLVLNSILAKLTIGIAVGDSAQAISQAETVYKLYLDNARLDGSFPQETRRGVSALKYSNMATGDLIMIAELAQGNDSTLFAYKSVNGVDIHRAVNFVVRSIENETLIAPYAKENFAPTDIMSTDGQARGFLRDHLGWASIYMRRFPNHENTLLLQAVLDKTAPRKGGYFDDILGGFVGCTW